MTEKRRPVLETTRLILRPFTMDDAPAVQRLVSDREIARNTLLIPHPYPEGAAVAWISTHAASFEAGKQVPCAITLRTGGDLVGAIDLVLKREHDRGELGYWIGVPYWNRGYVTEAIGAMIRYGFEELALNRIDAVHFTRNPSSGRAMVKNGMRHEGTMRQAIRKWDEYVDVEVYAILRDEWLART